MLKGPLDKTSGSKPGLRMNQLVQATGQPKSTILFYLDQGLLPQPVKTSPNMAYYDESCVERIAFIRKMQNQHRLPLQKIRLLLDLQDQGQAISPLQELLQVIFGSTTEGILEIGDFCEASGLSLDQVKELVQARMLLPLQDGRFDTEDLAMAKIYAKGMQWGITPADMAFYSELGSQIVDREMDMRQEVTQNLPMERDAEVTMQMVQAARATRNYVIDRLFQHRIAQIKDLKDYWRPKS